MNDTTNSPTKTFQLEEATIAGLHAAIRDGRATVTDVVKNYLARVRAYNGVASVLVTPDGGAGAAAQGVGRAGAALRFPSETVKASTILPHLENYKSPPTAC